MKQVAFLISMPRSGSTVVQRLIETDESILSCSEPWYLLPLLSIGNRDLCTSNYNDKLLSLAIKDAESELGVEGLFYQNINKSARQLYVNILASQPSKKIFLDKTPRYVHILPRLVKVFRDSSFIFLLRNPLDILTSYILTWCNGSFDEFMSNKDYLFDFSYGLSNLSWIVGGNQILLPHNSLVIRYEDLGGSCDMLKDGLAEIGINIDFSRLNSTPVSRPFGDPLRATSSSSISITIDQWKKLSRSNLISALDFIGEIDSSVFSKLGYDKLLTIRRVKDYLESPPCYPVAKSAMSSEPALTLGVAINIFNIPIDLLIRALSSCCNQTRKPNQIIIYDDASPTPLEERLSPLIKILGRRYSCIDIQYYCASRNKGIAASRDSAICMLNTDLVTHLDGDDFYRSHKLEYEEACLRPFSCHEAPRVVACSDVIVRINGKEIFKDSSRLCSSTDPTAEMLLRSCPIPRDLMMFKSTYLELARFNPEFEIYEDYHHKLRLSVAGAKWLHSGVVGTVYVRSSGGLSRRDESEHVKYERKAYLDLFPNGHPSQRVRSLFEARLRARLS